MTFNAFTYAYTSTFRGWRSRNHMVTIITTNNNQKNKTCLPIWVNYMAKEHLMCDECSFSVDGFSRVSSIGLLSASLAGSDLLFFSVQSSRVRSVRQFFIGHIMHWIDQKNNRKRVHALVGLTSRRPRRHGHFHAPSSIVRFTKHISYAHKQSHRISCVVLWPFHMNWIGNAVDGWESWRLIKKTLTLVAVVKWESERLGSAFVSVQVF